jgi:hypothetical protein
VEKTETVTPPFLLGLSQFKEEALLAQKKIRGIIVSLFVVWKSGTAGPRAGYKGVNKNLRIGYVAFSLTT